MTDLKVQHILTLTQLIARGARHNFVPITTSYLGKSIKKSQQPASKHLRELEEDGFIERIMNGRKFSVKITSKGYSEMVKLSSILKSSLNSFPSFVELKGTLVSGMGEGAYYMSLKGYTKQFKSKINNSIDCELIILERTHHDESIIELISKTNIRKTAKLRDSSKLTIRIPIMGSHIIDTSL